MENGKGEWRMEKAKGKVKEIGRTANGYQSMGMAIGVWRIKNGVWGIEKRGMGNGE